MAADETEQTEQQALVQAVPAQENQAPTETRVIAHWHQPDKRANQQGPIQGLEPVVGRQKKEPCYQVVHHIKNPGGFKINERLYQGRVVVPECVANTLNDLDRDWERVERSLYRDTPVIQTYHR